MFGYRYDLTCPFCQKQYEADHGITAFYKIKDILCVDEHCLHCNTQYIRPCGDVCPMTYSSEGSIKRSEVPKENLNVYTVCCF